MCIAALKRLRKRGMRIGGRHRFVVIDESKFAHKRKVGYIFVCICTILRSCSRPLTGQYFILQCMLKGHMLKIWYSPNLIKVSNYFSLFIFSTIAADVATLGAVNGNGCLGCWKLTGIPEDPFWGLSGIAQGKRLLAKFDAISDPEHPSSLMNGAPTRGNLLSMDMLSILSAIKKTLLTKRLVLILSILSVHGRTTSWTYGAIEVIVLLSPWSFISRW